MKVTTDNVAISNKFNDAKSIIELMPILKEHIKFQELASSWTFVPTEKKHEFHTAFKIETIKLKRSILITDTHLPPEIPQLPEVKL